MGSTSQYWHIVKLDSAGKRRVEMISAAKTYFQQQFPEDSEISDANVQIQLWQKMRQSEASAISLAETCLRCYISHKIDRVCLDLSAQFGSRNGFTHEDLLPFVLDDEGTEHIKSSYRSLATKILQSFDPAKGSLNTWILRYVRQHPEMRQFLLQQGVYLMSDWAILNDTNPRQLQRMLTQTYNLTSVEIQQASDLLQSYHAIYREDRIQQRTTGIQSGCQPPTPEQLNRIADDLKTNTNRVLHPQTILSQLQTIATKLRLDRIAAKGGTVPSASFHQPEIQQQAEALQSTQEDAEQIEFLQFYQNQLLQCLDQAIAQIISDLIAKLQRKRSSAQAFLTALHLFHCQGQSMSEIAPQIGLKKQYEVTRLLKLDSLRTDIRQTTLRLLRDRVLEQAKMYADTERLQRLDQQVELILDEQISEMIQEAEAETRISVRNQPLKSLLARRLCRYLNMNHSNP